MVSVAIAAQLEPTDIDPNDGKRSDKATIVPWSMSKCLIWDFTCPDTYALSYIKKTNEEAGVVAKLAT